MTHMRPRARFSRRRRLPRTIGSRRRHCHRRRRRGRRRRRRRRCGCLARATPACARPRSGPAAAAAQGAGSRAGCAAQPSGGRRRLAHGQHAAACSPPHVLTVCQTGVASRQASRQRLWPRWPALAQQTRAQLRSVCARAAEQPPRTSQAASVIRRLRTAEQSRQLGSLSTCPAASPSGCRRMGNTPPRAPASGRCTGCRRLASRAPCGRSWAPARRRGRRRGPPCRPRRRARCARSSPQSTPVRHPSRLLMKPCLLCTMIAAGKPWQMMHSPFTSARVWCGNVLDRVLHWGPLTSCCRWCASGQSAAHPRAHSASSLRVAGLSARHRFQNASWHVS